MYFILIDILHHVDDIRRCHNERTRAKFKRGDVLLLGVADRKRLSCFRPFKVADNTAISPRKNVADYQQCPVVGHLVSR